MEKPKLSHAVEGGSHAVFAGGIYAAGEYIMHHPQFAIVTVGGVTVLSITWLLRRRIHGAVKVAIKRRRKPQVYHLATHMPHDPACGKFVD